MRGKGESGLLVSVIVPCYNEERRIGDLLRALAAQTFPVNSMEVLIVDGMSTDGTREVIEGFARSHPDLRLRLIDNPDRIIPAALNRGVEAAQGEILLRLDAHSVPDPDYVQQSVLTLTQTEVANVGGLWRIEPGADTWIARSIAAAGAHPLGAGDARYRTRGTPGAVETVPFGAFRREWVQRIGGFNENLLTNEDYEFNTRLREAGGVVWFNPAIQSVYFSRPTLEELARQYFRYGYWKLRMLRRYPTSLRWRQALPPLYLVATLILGLASLIAPGARLLLGVQWGSYLAVLSLMAIIQAVVRRDFAMLVGFPLAIMTMHLAWGCGFLWSGWQGVTGANDDRE